MLPFCFGDKRNWVVPEGSFPEPIVSAMPVSPVGAFSEGISPKDSAGAGFGMSIWTIFTSGFSSLWRQTGEKCWARTLSMAQIYSPEA